MIPKVSHKIIIVENDEIPHISRPMSDAMNSFKTHNPHFEHKLYSGQDCIEYINKHYDERVLTCYLKLKPYAFRADFMRYLILYNEGGWYTDSKMVCFTSFNDFDKEIYLCIDAVINPNCMANGFMGSVPKHPILKKCIDLVMFNIEHEHYGMNSLYVTGPGILFNCALDYIRKNESKCGIGRHIINQTNQSFICFNKKIITQIKYNSPPQGGIYSDVPGGNNYGEMWAKWDVYN